MGSPRYPKKLRPDFRENRSTGSIVTKKCKPHYRVCARFKRNDRRISFFDRRISFDVYCPSGKDGHVTKALLQMNRTPTLSDVASLAGVSYATADRVVNARGGVAEKSRTKVQDAVKALGYVRNVAAANLSQQRTYHFGFVLPAGKNAFFDHMRHIIRQRTTASPAHQADLQIFDVEAFDVAALALQLQRLIGQGFDGLAVVGIDDPAICTAIEALRADGVAVVTLVSDVSASTAVGYIGVDNVAAGRTAGRLIGMAQSAGRGTVQIILGSLALRDHAERLVGALAVLAQDFEHINVLPPLEGLDQDPLVESLLHARLKQNPEISAIYGLGAGNNGIFRMMEKRNALTPRPFCVVHELIPDARHALEAGLVDAVIDQQPAQEIDHALALMRLAADRLPVRVTEPITPTIYLRDNLPAARPLPFDERPDHD